MPRTYISKKTGKVKVYKEKTGKRGRKSRYNDDLKAHAITLSRIGLANNDIARDLDIPITTFDTWLKKFPNFSDELDENRNKMLLDAKKCLAKRIEGYSYTETQVTEEKIFVKDKNDNEKEVGGKRVKRKVSKKFIPPDSKAAMYVLDKRSKHFRRQAEAIDEEIKNETFNVYVNEIKPPKKEKKK